MRYLHMAPICCLLICAPAHAFEFLADDFTRVWLAAKKSHHEMQGIPRLATCQPAVENVGAICLYSMSPSIVLGVINAKKIEAPKMVYLSWNGNRYASKDMVVDILGVGYALSPETYGSEVAKMGVDVYHAIRDGGSSPPEQSWRIGAIVYRLKPDPQLGARDTVLFSAVDTAVQ